MNRGALTTCAASLESGPLSLHRHRDQPTSLIRYPRLGPMHHHGTRTRAVGEALRVTANRLAAQLEDHAAQPTHDDVLHLQAV